MGDILTIVLLIKNFLAISRVTDTKILFKGYTPMKLMYQLTTSGFTKLFMLLILRSCLAYKLDKSILYSLFTIFSLSRPFDRSLE